MGLNRVKFHSLDSPLPMANGHSVIYNGVSSFGIGVDRGT